MKIAQRALETFAFRLLAGREQRLDQGDEIGSRKRFLKKMNRSQTRDLFALRGKMNRRENDRAGIGMTGAQIVNEFLRQVVSGVDVEDEESRLLVNAPVVALRLTMRHDRDSRPGRRFFESGKDFRRDLLIRLENEDLQTAR